MRIPVLLASLAVAGLFALGPRALAELDYFRASKEGNLENAERLCRRALLRHPGHDRARIKLEELEIRKALAAMNGDIFLSRGPYPFDVELGVMAGYEALDQRDLAVARSEFLRVIEVYSREPGVDVDEAWRGLREVEALLEDR